MNDNKEHATLLSIIIPAYNDAEALSHFLPQLLAFCQNIYQNVTNDSDKLGGCEIIIVDDGSQDNLSELYHHQVSTLPDNIHLKLIQFSRNFGKEPALSAGLSYAHGDYIAMMDADGQHPIKVLQQMYQMITTQNDIDMIAAIQANRPHESRLAKALKGGFYHFIQDGQRYQIRPNAGDFRLMKRKVAKAILSLPERQRFMKGLYAWVGFQTVYISFVADARQAGDSKFNYKNLFELAIVGITSFSQKPLRWISRMGLLVSMLSMLYGLYIVMDTLLFGNDVAGWATVAAGIMFSTGIQLICLGVIGEYVGRLYEEVKQRPLYLVDNIYDSADINGTNAQKTQTSSP